MRRIIGIVLLALFFIALGIGLAYYVSQEKGISINDSIKMVLLSFAISIAIMLIIFGITYLIFM